MTRIVVYVTREHPVSGADQLLVTAELVPVAEIEPDGEIEQAARRAVLETAGLQTQVTRELGSEGGSRFVQAVPLGSTPDDWEHGGARWRWAPVRTELAANAAFLHAVLRKRVVVYVTRERDGRAELLTIEHKDLPEEGIQVPAGRVDPGESLEEGVLRELAEETGLEGARVVGELPDFEAEYETPHESHAFHLVAETDTPDTWEHEVHGSGSDAGLVYVCRWVPLTTDLRLWNVGDPMLRFLP